MEKTAGIVILKKRQRWPMTGALTTKAACDCPYAIKVRYIVDNRDYFRWKFIGAGLPVPRVGSLVWVEYDVNCPRKARILD